MWKKSFLILSQIFLPLPSSISTSPKGHINEALALHAHQEELLPTLYNKDKILALTQKSQGLQPTRGRQSKRSKASPETLLGEKKWSVQSYSTVLWTYGSVGILIQCHKCKCIHQNANTLTTLPWVPCEQCSVSNGSSFCVQGPAHTGLSAGLGL